MPRRAPKHTVTPTSAQPVQPDQPSACKRGYDRRWQKARLAYLGRHPLCAHCEQAGLVTLAQVVDHIIPHKGNSLLFWDMESNWQSLCKPCHDKKTGTVDTPHAGKTFRQYADSGIGGIPPHGTQGPTATLL